MSRSLSPDPGDEALVLPPSAFIAIAGAISRRDILTTDELLLVSARRSSSDGCRPILTRPPMIPIVAGIQPVDLTISSSDSESSRLIG
jgi:hypothetical protein